MKVPRFVVYTPRTPNWVHIYVVELDLPQLILYRALRKEIKVKSLGSKLVKRYAVIGQAKQWNRFVKRSRGMTYSFETTLLFAKDTASRLNAGAIDSALRWVERKKGK